MGHPGHVKLVVPAGNGCDHLPDEGYVYLKGENNSANVSTICMPFLRKVSEEKLYEPWDVSC